MGGLDGFGPGYGHVARSCGHGNQPSSSIKCREFLGQLKNYWLPKIEPASCSWLLPPRNSTPVPFQKKATEESPFSSNITMTLNRHVGLLKGSRSRGNDWLRAHLNTWSCTLKLFVVRPTFYIHTTVAHWHLSCINCYGAQRRQSVCIWRSGERYDRVTSEARYQRRVLYKVQGFTAVFLNLCETTAR